ncbi:unnamed protein product [Eruca vesicaria subsp. sativa]|uniref:Uncharacterized protein n=1 Tax=Eruca vesicaria subsp. sativa TaxID=29727 RepID=A0ABC8IX37_ERUVS|nr:unnamed protein product [Eruca vesicaria subsp. sativa]
MEYNSLPYSRRRLNNYAGEQEGRLNREHHHRSPIRQWRAKSPVLDNEVTPPSAPFQPPRPSVGKNLEITDFPPAPSDTSREKVMEELRLSTLQYVAHPDPVECAARKQRVLQSEMDGTVDETATRMLQASGSAVFVQPEIPPEPMTALLATQAAPQEIPANPPKRRGRPRLNTSRRTSVRLSPKTFAGMGTRRRSSTRQHASPGTASRTDTRQAPS